MVVVVAVVPAVKNGLVANVVVERYVRSTNVRTAAKVRCWSAVTNVAACASNSATASTKVRSMATGAVTVTSGPYIVAVVVVVLVTVGPCQTIHVATAAVQYPGNVPAHHAVSSHRAASATVGNVHVSVHHWAPKGPWGRAIHQIPPTKATYHDTVFPREGDTP